MQTLSQHYYKVNDVINYTVEYYRPTKNHVMGNTCNILGKNVGHMTCTVSCR